MCNEFQIRINVDDWWKLHGTGRTPVVRREPRSNRPLNQPIKPTNRAPLLRPLDPANPAEGLESIERRWWLVPFFHKGPVSAWRNMCTNARIETVDTAPAFREAYRRRRVLVPITSFIEYDEPPGWKRGTPKRRWEATWAANEAFDEVRYLAGIWDVCHPSDQSEPLESFAFITGPPGPEVAAVHDRQPAVLNFEEGLEWLKLDGPGKAALVTETAPGDYDLRVRDRSLDFENAE
ncbi:SOS response-associated peptidase [Phenylobacterium montanum]|uniref:Abasic site processing protein n=1 Tax=Phenylobacterium montanum TaxID=2823693 RepID=A0A975IVB2_9CAUL|nr:SOS response-associated peptidase family protein [Caulobacter sp. S6]QUD88817.1 SOS response-associated peptidase family protein [Caulobacter sp. S6]